MFCSVTAAGELAEKTPRCRELILMPGDQRQFDGAWIENLPSNFCGRVTMLEPQYFVQVSVESDLTEASSTESRCNSMTLLPLDCEIRLHARDSDYACVTHQQHRLLQLTAMPANRLPRIVRIVDWDEVGSDISDNRRHRVEFSQITPRWFLHEYKVYSIR